MRTGLYTTRASTERHFGTDIIIRSKISLSKTWYHVESHQLARITNQSTSLYTTQAPTEEHFRTNWRNNRIQIFKSSKRAGFS